MKLEYCLYILDVVETGSIRKAAEKRFITQQGLSQAIKSVERELGVEIFFRNGNRIEVTSAGAVIIEHFRQLSGDYQDLLLDVSRQGSGDEPGAGSITIYYTTTVGALYAPAVLNRLVKRYPRIRIQMYPKKPPELFQLEYSPNTICICGCPEHVAEEYRSSGDEERRYHSFVRTPLLCVTSVTSPYAGRESVNIADLPGIPFAVFDDEVHMLDELLGSRDKASMTFIGSDYGLFKDIVSSTPTMGFGTAVTEYYFKRPNVVQIPFNAGINIEYGCVTSSGPLSPAVEDCVDIVRDELSKFSKCFK